MYSVFLFNVSSSAAHRRTAAPLWAAVGYCYGRNSDMGAHQSPRKRTGCSPSDSQSFTPPDSHRICTRFTPDSVIRIYSHPTVWWGLGAGIAPGNATDIASRLSDPRHGGGGAAATDWRFGCCCRCAKRTAADAVLPTIWSIIGKRCGGAESSQRRVIAAQGHRSAESSQRLLLLVISSRRPRAGYHHHRTSLFAHRITLPARASFITFLRSSEHDD